MEQVGQCSQGSEKFVVWMRGCAVEMILHVNSLDVGL